MKIAVISFTDRGKALGHTIANAFQSRGDQVETAVKNSRDPSGISCSVGEWARLQFAVQDALVFVGAAGIAVRAVAPCLRSKAEDAAVLVADERGRYCIPILSGHLGGANALAHFLADALGMEPVLTTATDINGKWAVDVFAAGNGLWIADLSLAKAISARLLREETVTFAIRGRGTVRDRALPPGLARVDEGSTDISIGIFRDVEKSGTIGTGPLHLVPRAVAVGVGCRRGTRKETIREAVQAALSRAGIWPESVAGIATIDRKAKEPGLLDYCREQGLALKSYTPEELQEVPGTFTASSFVREITGVDNVCERSAVKAAGLGDHPGQLIVEKQVCDSVTVALAEQEWSVEFEKGMGDRDRPRRSRTNDGTGAGSPGSL